MRSLPPPPLKHVVGAPPNRRKMPPLSLLPSKYIVSLESSRLPLTVSVWPVASRASAKVMSIAEAPCRHG